MSERYSRLFSLPENLYAEGAPVVIAAGALLKDNQAGKIVAQLKMRNISQKSIKAVTVCIHPLDTVGNSLGEEIEYQYLDLSAARDDDFGQKAPIAIPDASTRSFAASVEEVIFADNSIWSATGKLWEVLDTPGSLRSIGDAELVKQFRIKYGSNCKNLPLYYKDLWYCVCGELNRQSEAECHHCQKSLTLLEQIDMDALRRERDARVAEEKEQAEKEAAAAKAHAKKMGKIAAIVVPIIVVLIVVAVIVSDSAKKSNAYEFALSLAKSGQYKDAIEQFAALGDYKDSAEQICVIETTILEEQRAKAYADAIALLEDGKYGEAHAAFEALGDYKDSQERLKESLYHQGLEYLEQGNHMAAYDSFCAAGDYGDAKKQLEQFQKKPVKVEYSYGDGKRYVAYYDYTANGKILTYWSDEAKQRTEYFYNDDSVLIQVKKWNYHHLVGGEPSYCLIDFDANGIPVRYENTAYDIIVEYDHVFAEDGSIKSITCTRSQYSGKNTTRFNIVSATFDFSSEDKTYFVDKQSMGDYLNAFSSDRVYKRYLISVELDAIDIYEVGSYELDEHGNIIKASVRGEIFNEDDSWVNEYTVENTYDNDSNLIKVVEQDNKTHDTITYEYTYEHIYCPDVAKMDEEWIVHPLHFLH